MARTFVRPLAFLSSMSRIMSRIVIAAIAASIAVAATEPVLAFDQQPMDELRIGSSQRAVAAAAGSGCFRSGESVTCAEAVYPLTLGGILFIRPAHEIALDFDWPVEHVQVRVVEPRPEDQPCAGCFRGEPDLIDLRPVGAAPSRRWIGSIPPGLPRGLMRWSFSTRYAAGAQPTGSRYFEGGVYVLRSDRTHVRVPRLAGRSYEAATRELERRGLRWRRNRGALEFDTGAPPAPGAAASRSQGRVTAQSLRPGRRVRRGSRVRLTVR